MGGPVSVFSLGLHPPHDKSHTFPRPMKRSPWLECLAVIGPEFSESPPFLRSWREFTVSCLVFSLLSERAGSCLLLLVCSSLSAQEQLVCLRFCRPFSGLIRASSMWTERPQRRAGWSYVSLPACACCVLFVSVECRRSSGECL